MQKEQNSFWSKINLLNPRRAVKIVFVILAALVYIFTLLGYLSPARDFLDSISFSVGSIQDLSLYGIIKRSCSLILLLWLTTYLMGKGIEVIHSLKNVRASNRAIIEKLFQSLSYFVAFLMALSILNIDMSHFAIFSGA